MEVEIFGENKNRATAAALLLEDENDRQHREFTERLKKLELYALASRPAKSMVQRRIDAAQAIYGAPWDAKTYLTYRKFLPTRRSKNGKEWGSFAVTTPEPVITAIEQALEWNLFDDLILLEMGRMAVDPVVCGVIQSEDRSRETLFPIARWAEALLPIEEIEKFVESVRLSQCPPDGYAGSWVSGILAVCSFALSLALLGQVCSDGVAQSWIAFWPGVFFAIVCGVSVLVNGSKLRTHRAAVAATEPSEKHRATVEDLRKQHPDWEHVIWLSGY